MLKGAALVGGAIVLVLLLVWGIGQFNKTKPAPLPPAPVDNSVWIKPQAGERSLGILATGPVESVTLKDSAGTVLFQGSLKTGETRAVPYNQALVISTDTPQNLQVDYRGHWPIKEKTTSIYAPKPGQ